MRARGWWLVILALAVYAAVLVILHPNPKASTDETPGSSVSAEPVGDLAFARLWSRLGLPFQTFAEVPELLPSDTNAVFVSVEPQASQYNASDAAALLSFVKSGHQVVWVTGQSDAVTKALHLSIASSGGSGSTAKTANASQTANRSQTAKTAQTATTSQTLKTAKSLRWSKPGGQTTVSGLQLTVDHTLSGSGLKDATERIQIPGGPTVGAVLTEGKGQITVWSLPQVFENQGIGQANNLQIPWQLVGQQSVLWDEYGHGVVAQGLWRTLFGHGREGTLLLLLAAVIAYVVYGNTRFGHTREASDETPRLDVEFVHALTWHLSRRSLSKQRERLLDAAVRRRLCTLYGLPGTASWEALDAAVLPGLSPKLQQAYALWRAEDTVDGKPPTRSARKRRLAALQSLISGPDQADNDSEPTSHTTN